MSEIQYLEINDFTRIIKVPTNLLLGVMEDKDVERVYFKCKKIVGDNVDLSKHQLYVKYVNALDNSGKNFDVKTPGIYHCEDVVDHGDYITFSWLLSGNVFKKGGFVAFSVLASDGETTRWNTFPAIGTVLITIPGGLQEVEERYPDIITQLLNRMDEVEAMATPEAMQGYVNTYLAAHPAEIDPELLDPKKCAPADVVGQLKEDLLLLKNCNGMSVDFSIVGFLRADGTVETNPNGYITDWINVVNYDKIAFLNLYGNYTESMVIRDTIGIICFYNKNKLFISSVYKYKGLASDVINIPDNAVYARICKWYEGDSAGSAFVYLSTTSTIKLKEKVALLTEKVISLMEDLIRESINKPFNFTGETINAFGDSITAGVTSPGLQSGIPYIQYFADKVGATLLNWAVSGSTLSVLESWSPGSICTKLLGLSPKDIKGSIFIAGGTNDFNQNREIGDFLSTDVSTVCGAVRSMCEHIKNNMSDCTVIFITPIPYTQAYYDINLPTKRNSLGYTLNDYSVAIFDIATAFGYNVVDGRSLGMPTGKGGWNNLMCDDSDGCHPSAEGHKLYARSLAGKLL